MGVQSHHDGYSAFYNGSVANQYAGCKRWLMHGSASTPEFYMLAHSLASVKEMHAKLIFKRV